MARRDTKIRIDGEVAYVPLTKGMTAVIDAADVEIVEAYLWYADVKRTTVYARSSFIKGVGRIYLHRLLISPDASLQVDHKDGDGLNCRRGNLRPATNGENRRNQRVRKDSGTKIKGVRWDAKNHKWCARIKHQGQSIWLGRHSTFEAAHSAYAAASALFHGDFGRAE